MSLYTVEQIELVRRLRQTGIKAEQILEAFQSLDRLDQDLGVLGDDSKNPTRDSVPTVRPDSSSSSSFANAPVAANFSSPLSSFRDSGPSPLQIQNNLNREDNSSLKPRESSQANGHSSTPILLQHLTSQRSLRPAVAATATATPITAQVSSNQWSETFVSDPLTSLSPHSGRAAAAGSGAYHKSLPPTLCLPSEANTGALSDGADVSDVSGVTISDSSLEDSAEIEDFLKQGEERAIQEMKAFVNQYQIRQTTIGQMTRVSQPYVSKFLNGNCKELSSRVRMILFKWYLSVRAHPERLAQLCTTEPMPSRLDLGLEHMQQRRERYVFRPILLQVLEHYFSIHQYPDLQKRMEIAADCNRALAAERRGAPLMKKERVSPQIVANWFANKRKDNKRKGLSNSGQNSAGSGSTGMDSNCDFPERGVSASPSSTEFVGEENEVEDGTYCGGPSDESPSISVPGGTSTEATLTALQSELAAVNNSVMALVNPYDDSLSQQSSHVKMESE